MNWLYLFLSSIIEIFWIITLKHSYGFTHLIPSLVNVLTMTLSTYLLSLATRSIPIGICYAIWTGVGAIGASLLGIFLFNESVNLFRIMCLILITFGVIGLKLFDNKD
ncbi:DMT family transporter [Wolbachia endosymbiont of Folsomia candida]|uniref:DMT family transporter n=1 Tax=Wolbachia endosymbiont of Folsomia candida TaxID=169402 RepID=UPI000A71F85F|nr:SMR family transporter [Wolbachia endosymbiont of Folsomia candida]APR98364.1 QacE family quaternary ammonium compound efflux SMR transporter [Wolbachia endosymbiont of Folsomia candida]